MTRHLTLIGAAMAAAMLVGCGSTPPAPTVWLAVPAVTATAAQTTAPLSADANARHAPTVVVQRLRVPEYLQTTALRYRDGEHSFAEWPQARWAERVEVNLTRHLAQSLQAQRSAWRWCEAPCSQPGSGSVQVAYQSLEIQRAAREVVAVVHWQISPPGLDAASGHPRSGSGQGPVQGLWQHRQPITGDTPQAQVAALAAINAALAQALAEAWDQATKVAPVSPPSAPTPSPGV
jgi:uncharacterized lipoprotein YmbA